MKYTFAAYSDIGKCRENEDSFRIAQNEDTLIAIVADGLGGHANGKLASRIAAEQIPQYLIGKEFGEDELGYAILEASDAICKTKSSACTTVASLWIKGDTAIAAHVGDSRIYHFRDESIIFQSEDHSIVQIAVSLGELPKDACRNHKDRNKVYRVLGEESEKPRIDAQELTIRPGDCFLLCSDGFWEPVTEKDMLASLRASATPEIWLEKMVSLVRKADSPKQDNNTAIAVFANAGN